MKQQLPCKGIEQIGRKSKPQGSGVALEFSQLSFIKIERIKQDCEQLRSEAIADLFISLFKAIGTRMSAVISTLKTGDNGKAIGASAR